MQLTSKPFEIANLKVKCRVAESKALPSEEVIWPEENIVGNFATQPAIGTVAENNDDSANQSAVCVCIFVVQTSQTY